MGDGCLVDKATDRPDLVWSTLHNNIKNTIRLFLNCILVRIQEALLTVQFTSSSTISINLLPVYSNKLTPLRHIPVQDYALHFPMPLTLQLPVLLSHVSPIGASQVVTFMYC